MAQVSERSRGDRSTLSPGLALAIAAMRHLRSLVVAPLVLTALVVGLVLVRGRSYTAESVIAPEAATGPSSRLAGLAAQFGLSGMLAAPGAPVEFYQSVVNSRELLRQVAEAGYVTERGFLRRDTVRGPLVDIWRIRADTREEATMEVVERLRESVEAIPDVQAGVLRIRTTSRAPALAEQINRQVLAYLNDFNVHKRQTHAEQERIFIESRLEVARAELEAAEKELASFYEANRSYQNSPRLAFEAARLERRVQIRQEVYRTLAQAYEEARIQEVRNTPVFTVVDPPEGSALPAIRLSVLAPLVLSVSFLLAAALVLVLEYLRDQRTREVLAFADAVATTGKWPISVLIPMLARRMLAASGGERGLTDGHRHESEIAERHPAPRPEVGDSLSIRHEGR